MQNVFLFFIYLNSYVVPQFVKFCGHILNQFLFHKAISPRSRNPFNSVKCSGNLPINGRSGIGIIAQVDCHQAHPSLKLVDL